MHNYIHSRLPFSFNETWMFNHRRNPERVLSNANNLYVLAHHYATVKRFPLYSFPLAWNEEENRKFNPSHNLYCKQLKESLLSNLAGCSAQTRTGMGHLRKPPGVELIPAVD
jgi:hypothetical protein